MEYLALSFLGPSFLRISKNIAGTEVYIYMYYVFAGSIEVLGPARNNGHSKKCHTIKNRGKLQSTSPNSFCIQIFKNNIFSKVISTLYYLQFVFILH